MRPYCQVGSSASHGFHCSRVEHIVTYRGTSCSRGYGAAAARLTPDQKVGSSSLSGLTYFPFALSVSTDTESTKTYSKLKNPRNDALV